MGLFDKLMKKHVAANSDPVVFPVMLGAVAKGRFVPMEKIPDDVFSQGILGICCGIDPMEGKVYAPIGGKISSLTGTKHAIGIEGNGGIEILIHVGVDTVDMSGDGFVNMVKEGDVIEKGQLLLTMDLDKIKAAGHPTVVITAVTNGDDFNSVEFIGTGDVKPGDSVLRIQK